MKSVFDIAFHVEHECHADHVPTDVLIEALQATLNHLVKNPNPDEFGRPDWAKFACCECNEPADHTPCGERCDDCFCLHSIECDKCREWYKAGEGSS